MDSDKLYITTLSIINFIPNINTQSTSKVLQVLHEVLSTKYKSTKYISTSFDALAELVNKLKAYFLCQIFF